MKSHILITGALGLVGSELLRRLLHWDQDCLITVLIRPKGSISAENRFNELWKELFPSDLHTSSLRNRVQVLSTQLDHPLLGLTQDQYQELANQITEIFHIAASVRFDLSLEDARLANVRPTENLIELAKVALHSTGNFKHFHFLSTYATVRNSKIEIVREDPCDLSQDFTNTYEKTKAEAETFVLSNKNEIPVSIYRPSIIGGDSKTGWTSKFDTFYLTIQLFLSEMASEVPTIPVSKNGVLDAVTIDFVADALYLLYKRINQSTQSLESGKIFHLVAGDRATPIAQALRDAIQLGAKHLKTVHGTSIHIPEIIEFEDLTAEKVTQLIHSSSPSSLELYQIFQRLMPYAFDSCRFDNSNLLEVLKNSNIYPKSIHEHLPAIVDYCLSSQWGKKPGSRPLLTDIENSKKKIEPIAIIGIGDLFSEDEAHLEFSFDETRFRIPPLTAQNMDRLQKLVLVAAEKAIENSGICLSELSPENLSKAGMILGYGGVQVESDYYLSSRPAWGLIREHLKEELIEFEFEKEFQNSLLSQLDHQIVGSVPHINEDSLAGSLPNVAVGRVMNYFDFKGPSYVVNTGISSSLAAIEQAIDSLKTFECDWMIAGGVQTKIDPVQKACLLEENEVPPQEGIGLFVLKRLSDAIRDGNKISGLIRSVGRSSNGKRNTIYDIDSDTIDSSIHQPNRPDQFEPPSQTKYGGATGAHTLVEALRQVSSSQIKSPKQLGILSFGNWGQAYHLVLEEWNPDRFPDQLSFTPLKFREPVRIAIVGMGSVLPGSKNPEEFWNHLISGKEAIQEIPLDLWQGYRNVFFDHNRDTLDKTYGSLGAFAPPVQIDPFLFGIPPVALEKMDRAQKHFLDAAMQAIQSVLSYPLPENLASKTSLIVGESKSSNESSWKLALIGVLFQLESILRQTLNDDHNRDQIDTLILRLKQRLSVQNIKLDEDARAGTLFPAAASRMAKVINAKGGVIVADAACASSFAALSIALRELSLGKQDCIIYGGVGVSVTPGCNIPFARCQALSATGSRPLDETADGIILGEGSVVLILKRLENAIQDNDHVYSILKGLGASSDGKGHSMMAPSSAGQKLAIQRALAQSGARSEEIDYIECHSTGTQVGDETEIESIVEAYFLNTETSSLNAEKFPHDAKSSPLNTKNHLIRIGSVKSQIGHTIGAAGAAGLLKVILSMEKQTLPPTRIPTQVHPKLTQNQSRIRVNVTPKNWVKSDSTIPRKAGVSAFGFGGTNWHVIVEEGQNTEESRNSNSISSSTYMKKVFTNRKADFAVQSHRFEKNQGKCAFLFPGHGSPSVNSGASFYENFPVFRATFREANETLLPLLGAPVENLLFTKNGSKQNQIEANLFRTELVQPILLTLDIAYYRTLREIGIKPNIVLGHSVGEFAAAVAAGMLSFEQALWGIYHRGKIFRDQKDQGKDTGKMAAVFAYHEDVRKIIIRENIKYLNISTINSPAQTVISGPSSSLPADLKYFHQQNMDTYILPVEVAWHSPLAFDLGQAQASQLFSQLEIKQPHTSILSNADLKYYDMGSNPKPQVVQNWVSQLGSEMNFIHCVEKLYQDNVRVFIEVGPRKILSRFVSEILKGKPYRVISMDDSEKVRPSEVLNTLAQEV